MTDKRVGARIQYSPYKGCRRINLLSQYNRRNPSQHIPQNAAAHASGHPNKNLQKRIVFEPRADRRIDSYDRKNAKTQCIQKIKQRKVLDPIADDDFRLAFPYKKK